MSTKANDLRKELLKPILVDFRSIRLKMMGKTSFTIKNDLVNSSKGDRNEYNVNNHYECTQLECEK